MHVSILIKYTSNFVLVTTIKAPKIKQKNNDKNLRIFLVVEFHDNELTA